MRALHADRAHGDIDRGDGSGSTVLPQVYAVAMLFTRPRASGQDSYPSRCKASRLAMVIPTRPLGRYTLISLETMQARVPVLRAGEGVPLLVVELCQSTAQNNHAHQSDNSDFESMLLD